MSLKQPDTNIRQDCDRLTQTSPLTLTEFTCDVSEGPFSYHALTFPAALQELVRAAGTAGSQSGVPLLSSA